MECALKDRLKEEHAKMTKPAYAGVIFHCPVLGRQMCLWCCLHLSDLADPMKRSYAMTDFFRYADVAKELSGRDLDSIHQTCVHCRNR